MEFKIGKTDFENYFREKEGRKKKKREESTKEIPKKPLETATKSFDDWEENEKGKNIDIYV